MDEQSNRLRQQFDILPYPINPLEQSPKSDTNLLFIHNFVTAYYLRNRKVTQTQGKVILDAGCGTGYGTLVLAEANPEAEIIGVDFSKKSIEIAQNRLSFHGFDKVKFYAISLDNISDLGVDFDYINCDEVLYLLPDPVAALKALKSVLKPDGIIRTNLHSALQRTYYFRAQEVFKMMGLMDSSSENLEVGIVREIMLALKDQVAIKAQTWTPDCMENDHQVQLNYLLKGDKGFTVPEMFVLLATCNLKFISMVQWRHWELSDLFKEPDDLPLFLGMSLPETSVEERLHLFELLHPIHRLLDFWCGHSEQADVHQPITEWNESRWRQAVVHLHSQLKTVTAKEALHSCVAHHLPFEISRYLSAPAKAPIFIESTMAACLLPLWDSEQPVSALVERWLKLRPLHPVTLEPIAQETALEQLLELLQRLESVLYVLLE